jgi:lipopolysaccharide export system permease protein
MTLTMTRYIAKLTAGRILASMAVLLGILQVLDLLDVTTDILDRKLGAAGVAYYAMLRLPRLIEQAAPLSVLAGCLFAFAQLARDSAVTAMRATGMSAYRLMLMAMPAALMVVVIHFAVSAGIAPRTDRILNDWWLQSTPVADVKPKDSSAFRIGPDVIVATQADDAGRKLKNVVIYHRDAVGRLVQKIVSPSAERVDGRWRLTTPTFLTLAPEGVRQSSAASMVWTDKLKPQDVRAVFNKDQMVSAGSARRALLGGASDRPQAFYATELWRLWAAPAGAVVMLLLSAPVALAHFRGGQGGTLLVSCLGAGLLFLVVDGVFTAIGQGGAAPPFLAAWAAPIIFGSIGLATLVHLEG